MGRNLLRLGFVGMAILLGVARGPFSSPPWEPWISTALNAASGALLALVGLGLAALLERVPLRALTGGLAGMMVGALTAAVLSRLLPVDAPDFLQPGLYLVFVFLGIVVGASRTRGFSLRRARSMLEGEQVDRDDIILDTSVIIDGRIADICETGFLHGRLVVPQFVLDELQAVADSADPLKRNRGRKGLEILRRLQHEPGLDLALLERDFPTIPEVDQKLIALAKELPGRIVTNDFNLNQVAQVHGIQVLNINDLANALKPVVLPGEPMRVFILKGGKEERQGIAYLDDGTMVVVDDARDSVGKTIDITVTSVLQTTVGKMFFARHDPQGSAPADPRPAQGRGEPRAD
jgi:uncharacterized protein YacL